MIAHEEGMRMQRRSASFRDQVDPSVVTAKDDTERRTKKVGRRVGLERWALTDVLQAPCY